MSAVPFKMSLPSTLPTKFRSPALAAAHRRLAGALDLLALPLMASFADVEQADGWVLRIIVEHRHQGRAHHGELQQVLGRAIHVGSRSSTVVAPPFWFRDLVAMAGRSMPSSVLST